LRYGREARDALNISHLPRARQDEIIIEAMQKRVKGLEELIESQRKIDAERIRRLGRTVVELKESNEELHGEVSRAN